MQKTKRYFPLVETENSHSKVLVDLEKAEITIKKIDWRTDTADVMTFPICELSEIAKKLMEIDTRCKIDALAKAVTFSRACRKLERDYLAVPKNVKIVKQLGNIVSIDGQDVYQIYAPKGEHLHKFTIGRRGVYFPAVETRYWADWMLNYRGTSVSFPHFSKDLNTAFLFKSGTNEYLGRAFAPTPLQS